MRHGIALNKIHLHQLRSPSEHFGVQICTVGLLVGELVWGRVMRHGIALNKIHLQQLGSPSECYGVQICKVGLLVGELAGGGFVVCEQSKQS